MQRLNTWVWSLHAGHSSHEMLLVLGFACSVLAQCSDCCTVCAVMCCDDAEYTPVLLDDRRLMIFQLGKNYRDAYAFCKNDVNKATLATLNNPTETQRLLAIGPVNTVQALWIGLTNTLPPDSTWLPAATDRVEWKWISTGKPPEWDHWSNQLPPPEAEPNDWVNSEGSCAAVYSALVDERPDGFWND